MQYIKLSIFERRFKWCITRIIEVEVSRTGMAITGGIIFVGLLLLNRNTLGYPRFIPDDMGYEGFRPKYAMGLHDKVGNKYFQCILSSNFNRGILSCIDPWYPISFRLHLHTKKLAEAGDCIFHGLQLDIPMTGTTPIDYIKELLYVQRNLNG